MKNIYKNSLKNLNKAKKILDKLHVIAVPTETVYGLAGSAYSDISVKKIYKIKKRPSKNPLIVHYHDLKGLETDVYFNKDFLKLYRKFSPGPITYVLKKRNKSKISNLATANLNTIAIRFPKNKIIRRLLKKLNFPLAIPSANLSSNVSPISAEDVKDEFGKKINFILDGGKSKIGLESTVINLHGKLKILRPGAINYKKIRSLLKKNVTIIQRTKTIRSPGLLKRHYSPGIPIKLNCIKPQRNAAFIVFGKKFKKDKDMFNLSFKGDLKEAARNLYKTLRKIKNLKYRKINVVKIPNRDIGIAINDRLKRASY